MPPEKAAPRLYLIDGSSYIFRAFHAVPPLTNKAGLPTNAVFGFTNMLLKLLNEERPDGLAVVFDAGGPTFRDEMYADYKAHRPPMPEELIPQLPYVRKVVEALRVPVIEVPGVEADDAIATLATSFASAKMQVVIVTGDKDMMQLVGPNVMIVDTMRDRRIGIDEVRKRFGIEPERVIEVMGLMGDSVDNIPGVKGIGEKTAQALIQKFGSIDNLLAHLDEVEGMGLRGARRIRESLAREADQAKMSRELARLRCDVAVEVTLDDLRLQSPDYAALRPLFAELGFQSLLGQVAPRAPTKSGTTGWVEDRVGLETLLRSLANVERIALEPVVGGDPAAVEALAIAFNENEACVVRLSAEGGPSAADLAPLLAAERPRKVGGDLKRAAVLLARQGVDLRGIDFDVGVASYLVNPSRQSHRVEDLALELLGRSLVTGLDESPAAAGEAAAERARSCLPLETVLARRLAEQGAEALFREMEMPLVTVLARMERRGVRVDLGLLGAIGAEFEGRLAALLREIYALAGVEFNVSSPPQLREVLFERLKISSRGVRRGKTGLSTDVDVLTRLAHEHPLPAKILEYRSLAKLKSTYVDALPALVDPATGRIHTSFNQTVAATGRLSSSEPNLQNIPIRTEEGRRIRAAFLPATGCRLVSADYSQIELRVLAHMSGDETLISAFRAGEDIHRRTAAEVFHVAPETVGSDQRRVAKVINFGILYGMGPSRLAKELGISFEEAEKHIRNYFARYPGVSEYIRTTLEEARRLGYVTTLFGRRRYIPDLASPQGGVRQFAERMAVNTPIQGTAADLIKAAMVRIDRRLQELGGRASMILQVHDELIFDVPEGEVPQVVESVRQEMEGAARLRVPLEVDVRVGSNWAELH